MAKTNRSGKATSPVHIGTVISGSLSRLGVSHKLKEFKIKRAWQEVVGRAINRRARPDRLIGKTLHVVVTSSPWMTELKFQERKIVERINEVIGEPAVGEIVFKPGTVKVKAADSVNTAGKTPRQVTPEEKLFIERTVSGIKDDKLKAVIRRTMEKGKG